MKGDLEAKLALGGEEVSVKASLEGEALTVELGGRKLRYAAHVTEDGEVTLRAEDGRVIHGFVTELVGPGPTDPGGLGVSIGGRTAHVVRVQAGKRAARSADEAALEAPMPGNCRDVFVAPGAKVEKGQRLVLIEAMKMEHEIRAPRAGVVKAVHARKGELVSPGAPLVELEA
jgi:biotin carboxyl carrier protein